MFEFFAAYKYEYVAVTFWSVTSYFFHSNIIIIVIIIIIIIYLRDIIKPFS